MKPFALTIRQLRTLCRIAERALIFRPNDIIAANAHCMLRLPWVPDPRRNFELRAADLAPWLRMQDEIAKIDGASYVTKIRITKVESEDDRAAHVKLGTGPIRMAMVLAMDDDVTEMRATRTSNAVLIPPEVKSRTISDDAIRQAMGEPQPGVVGPFAFDPSLLRHAQRIQCHFGNPAPANEVWLQQAPHPRSVTWWGIDTPHGVATLALMPCVSEHVPGSRKP